MTLPADVKKVVQIYIYEGSNTQNTNDKNNVAVVVPAAVDMRYLAAGEKVRFENCTGTDGVQIWFPRKWYVEETAQFFTLASGASKDLQVDPGHVGKDATEQSFQYQVYCGAINEFAVGDSPPKMDVPPPPPGP